MIMPTCSFPGACTLRRLSAAVTVYISTSGSYRRSARHLSGPVGLGDVLLESLLTHLVHSVSNVMHTSDL